MVTVFFQTVPISLNVGEGTTLSWIVTGSTSQYISNQIGPVSAIGSMVVFPTTSTVYTLTATDGTNVVSESITIAVFSTNVSFSLQKVILSLKQDRVPVRGKNG